MSDGLINRSCYYIVASWIKRPARGTGTRTSRDKPVQVIRDLQSDALSIAFFDNI